MSVVLGKIAYVSGGTSRVSVGVGVGLGVKLGRIRDKPVVSDLHWCLRRSPCYEVLCRFLCVVFSLVTRVLLQFAGVG